MVFASRRLCYDNREIDVNRRGWTEHDVALFIVCACLMIRCTFSWSILDKDSGSGATLKSSLVTSFTCGGNRRQCRDGAWRGVSGWVGAVAAARESTDRCSLRWIKGIVRSIG